MQADETIATTLELAEPVATHVPVGAEMVVTVRIISPVGDAAAGGAVSVMAGDTAVTTGTFAASDTDAPVCAIPVQAPERLGTYVWHIVFAEQTVGGLALAESAVLLQFETVPHATSLAVWDLPSPATVGKRVRLKVGAKSAGGYPVVGALVEVLDEAGTILGSGRLADKLSGSKGLYWCELDLAGPDREGVQRWSARFAASELEVPHLGSGLAFTFVAAAAAEHRLVTRVVDREKRSPIAGVVVRVGAHRATTDSAGVAAVTVPTGTHELIAWHARHQMLAMTVEIGKDATLEVLMVALPAPRDHEWM